MFTGSELSTAIAAVLIGAVCVGYLLHVFWSHLNRSRTSNNGQLNEMATRLHEADMSREAVEEALEKSKAQRVRRETEIGERLAVMQVRLDGAIEGREADLTTELAATRLDLETMREGLSNARRRNFELEAEIEALKGLPR